MSDVKKQLTIRTGAVRRLTKELKLYQEELLLEQSRVDKLRASGADKHDLKHAEDVLAEAGMMIPNTAQRLKENVQELLNIKDEAPSELSSTDEYSEATRTIKLAQELVTVH